MIYTNNKLSLLILGLAILIPLACSDKTPTNSDDSDINTTKYFVGIEAATDPATDVLTFSVSSIDSGMVSPINNGFEQPAWMTFFQGNNQIMATGYTSAPEFVSYSLVDGELTQGESFFTDLGTYAFDFDGESKMILVGSAREGLADKKIFLVNTDAMAIEKSASHDFGNIEADSILAFPNDAKIRGDKLFISYYGIHANGNFSTPKANTAKVAVFSYPGLEFEKIISDNRAPNIGRYYGFNSLEADENGDIYTISPSALASGYNPVPETNSGILRIKNGESEFDANYHIDFEELSGGYKLQDLIYVGNGKAVVRVFREEETNSAYLWATYSPNSENPLLETGIVDLYNETFTLLENVPLGGGGWNAAYLVEDNNVFLGVSNSSYSGIYNIDTETNTASEGAKVEGNYAKAILSLTAEQE
ncbi:DUF4374 domain-containing protein [Gracilimonas sp.]|uniref:DUF4374 domain-containing protein n=1 Tax=Gracilimonas sp. TaxID=1974203 RepID=UPI003BAB2657